MCMTSVNTNLVNQVTATEAAQKAQKSQDPNREDKRPRVYYRLLAPSKKGRPLSATPSASRSTSVATTGRKGQEMQNPVVQALSPLLLWALNLLGQVARQHSQFSIVANCTTSGSTAWAELELVESLSQELVLAIGNTLKNKKERENTIFVVKKKMKLQEKRS
ncbi:hypothetical protein V6N13_124881 [Hibiscus sabdariffa]